MIVTDARGARSVATTNILIGDGNPALPDAWHTVHPSTVIAGRKATFAYAFSTTSARSGGAPISRYTWDFGDGSPVASTAEPAADHTYAQAGAYTARVTLQDQKGDTGDAALTIIVTDPQQTGGPIPAVIAGALVLGLLLGGGYFGMRAFPLQRGQLGRQSRARKRRRVRHQTR